MTYIINIYNKLFIHLMCGIQWHFYLYRTHEINLPYQDGNVFISAGPKGLICLQNIYSSVSSFRNQGSSSFHCILVLFPKFI